MKGDRSDKFFDTNCLRELVVAKSDSRGEDNGQVVIVGGSKLFHGAPVFSLKVASRICDMVFFASPEESVGRVAERIKASLMSFVWVPWVEVDEYVAKSDAVLIGPGFMRFRSEMVAHGDRYHKCDEACLASRFVTQALLDRFPNKKWVIDAGSLQVLEKEWIPTGAVLTPNRKEFDYLFDGEFSIAKYDEEGDRVEIERAVSAAARRYKCVIVLKGVTTLVCSPEETVWVRGGNAGLTKGGTGDTQAGLTVALLSKNRPFLAASVAAYVVKAAADDLHERVGVYFNADDLADEVPKVLWKKLEESSD